MTVRHDGLAVEWLGYATIRLAGEETVVYFDPGRYGVLTGEWEPDEEGLNHPPGRDYRPEDGDVICVSHVHHYDPDGIERVASEDATVVAFEGIDGQDRERGLAPITELPYELRTVDATTSLSVDGVSVWSTPAHNEPDGPHTRPDGTPYHPEGFGCGFLVDVEGTRAFWPGDTDVLPGHRSVDVSLFCPPIGQRFTMDRHEAAGLAATIEPNLVMPVHYNTFSTLATDSRAFAADVAAAGVPVVLDEQ
ncbi:MBL fold metallo-hydrolase [Halomicrobium sp. IBSBa]|uniref:MBL fold metallo-hydrolase n=1 Tax=Halomicrobium mukohataei TaxID=57705 RepID=A0A847U8J0_9EURY|nr:MULTISPECIES: MBL fold metallo-hydrolase [Halomicrobium]MBO4249420.1 MBL fold metallo-hydrolase [Halomicrobium sp. IBSBa]NLV08866.1 MBL fold metallo-hydrolase [Halomicrobium mukohataei]